MEQAPPTLNFANTVNACKALMSAGQVPYLIGGPGLGKSAAASLIAQDADRVLVPVIGSNLDPTDAGGLPITIQHEDGTRELIRVPLAAFRECCKPGRILFFDELTGVPLAVRQPLLRVILEKVAGDLVLSPDLWVMCAGNLPEQCPAGQEIDAALGNRLKQIEFAPTLDEVCNHLSTLGEPGSPLREIAIEWAAVAREDGRLVQMTPPDESIETGAPFASPRACEGLLRGLAEARRMGLPSDLQRAIVASCVGEAVAARYWGVVQYRAHLPSVDEICTDPMTAKLSDRPEHLIALIGVLALAAERDGWATWVYADRLPEEAAARATYALQKVNAGQRGLGAKSPHLKAGGQAKKRRIIAIQRSVKGRY